MGLFSTLSDIHHDNTAIMPSVITLSVVILSRVEPGALVHAEV